jgi:hypothetical protein
MNTVQNQVKMAYADCWMSGNEAYNLRNLKFRASQAVSRDEAYEIMNQFVPGYNAFESELIKKFPKNAQIVIAREGSVCLYVKSNKYPSAKSMSADEKDKEGEFVRYWWD